MSETKNKLNKAWSWVPSLYFAEGIPYVIVMTVAVIMYKRMGISNTDIALYTSWLYLPWVIKPFWSPIVDMFKTKKFWIITMQLIIGGGLAGVALTIPLPNFFQYTLAFLWLLAFSSATHDIAADGFYMIGLSKHDQAFFVGIRSTFYRIAMITGQGLLIILAGYLESSTGLSPVDIELKTLNQKTSINIPDDNFFNNSSNELSILVNNKKVEIGTNRISRTVSDSIKSYVQTHNNQYGFYISEQESKSANNSFSNKNWLERILFKYFGEHKAENKYKDSTGNITIVCFMLNKKPVDESEVVVTFGKSSGDENISLVEGSRFIFNESNWNIPAYALLQLDPKLNGNVTTNFTARAGNIPLSWMITFGILAGIFFLFFVYHKIVLPTQSSDKSTLSSENVNPIKEFFYTFIIFFKKEKIGLILAFLLLYRLGESQLVKLASPFLLDAKEVGGLGLTTGEVGLVYGTIGIIALTLGGILGGFLASRHGLKYWLIWMLIAINVPNTVYVYLSYVQPDNFFIINLCVALEQFGYGFGFTAYMLYMLYVSDGEHKTAHFAITTGFMALGMMIPGMISGWLQEIIGYQNFFIWVIIATIPAFIVTKFIPLDPNYGKK